MAKIVRETQKIFGANAPLNQVTSFGSIKDGNPVYTSDIGDLQTEAFETGWSAAVEDDYAPYRQDRNAVDKVTTSQLAYQFQEGVAEWDSGTTYYQGGIVKVLDGNKFTLYRSLIDENIGNNPLTDTTNWVVWTDNTFPYARITNCITEIPQDIKLELKDGVLTLKAGSKVYVPNGAGVFDVVIVPNDVVFHTGTIGDNTLTLMFACNLTGGFGVRATFDYFESGSTPPQNTSHIWYDTINNAVKGYENGSWVRKYSLPIGIYYRENGNAVAIDQVFNGFGYIGSTVFALPGVKGLIPNGRNEDGTLKSIETTNDKVLTYTGSVLRNNASLGFSNLYVSPQNIFLYDTERNINLSGGTNPAQLVNVATWSADRTGHITSFTPKTAFHAVDYNDFNRLDEEVVKTSGSQDISGKKTFKDLAILNASNNAKAFLKSQTIDITTAPTAQQNNQIYFVDKNEFVYGVLQCNQNTDKQVSFLLTARNETSSYYNFGVIVYPDGTGVATAPTPVSTATGTQVTTAAWVRSKLFGIDYANPTAKISEGGTWAANSTYTVPQAGYVIISSVGASSRVKVNDTVVGQVSTSGGSGWTSPVGNVFLPVQADDKITTTGDLLSCYFYFWAI